MCYRIARYFQGTKILRFCGFLLVLENKYPRKTEYCTITCVSKMALHKYFKPINRSILSLPSGPLSDIVPSSSIEAANKEVESIVSQVEKVQVKMTRREIVPFSDYSRPHTSVFMVAANHGDKLVRITIGHSRLNNF